MRRKKILRPRVIIRHTDFSGNDRWQYQLNHPNALNEGMYIGSSIVGVYSLEEVIKDYFQWIERCKFQIITKEK